MTDLTDKLKKGELLEGYYYIKTDGETNIDEYVQWYKDNEIPSEKSFVNFNVEQVLTPVPSYEEWQAKLKENTQLNDLLKECREILNMVKGETIDFAFTVDRCIEKINQALREDK